MSDFTFVVVCRDDAKPDGSKGDYTLATRRVFATREEAGRYARTVSPSRDPLAIEGRWGMLRLEGLVD